MEIYKVLSSKKHNSHYLKRYIKFIKNCIQKNELNTNLPYTETHHICPKAKDMFPEYADLKANPWNKAVLTYRQHIIAHLLLWKTYDNTSQTLSVLRTLGQTSAKGLSVKTINTRTIEQVKGSLSDKRKGVFTRGYDETGKPLVSSETRKKISESKVKFYSDPKNREAQSRACTGTTGRKSPKYSAAAKNRSDKHKKTLQSSIAAAWKRKKLTGDTRRIKEGVYVTPVGNFSSTKHYATYCRNNKKPFSVHNVKKNPKLNKSVVGLTPEELGFKFIPRDHPEFEQHCVDLNQGHQPEPNHPLASELNDFLLQEISHHRS